MEINTIASNLEKKENGIYYAKSAARISYPEKGNENFMQIEEDSFWFRHRNDVIVESVNQFSADKIFFDIGGGNGFVSKKLHDKTMSQNSKSFSRYRKKVILCHKPTNLRQPSIQIS